MGCLETDPIIVMGHCPHNVIDSFHKRYLKETPKKTGFDRKLVFRIIDYLSTQIRAHVKPFDAQNYLFNKKGKLRARYVAAYKDLCKNGFDHKKSSRIKTFVKNERFYEQGKSARLIMGRDPAFNILYAQIIEVVEKAFFKLPQVTNACDNKRCGEKLEELLGSLIGESDQSKFEAHQDEEHLWWEFCVYHAVLPELTEKLLALFVDKMFKEGIASFNKALTYVVIVFRFVFCRGSGDMDTSLGNGVLNFILTMYFLVINTCSVECKFDQCTNPSCCALKFRLKGDDNYFRINSRTYIDTFAQMGFDAKIKIHDRTEDLEFCSGHFVEYAPGKFIYVQKIKKMIHSLSTIINTDIIRNGWAAHYYKSVGLMYKKLYCGIPLYDELADFLLRSPYDGGININLVDSHNLKEMYNHSVDHTLGVVESLVGVSVAMVNGLGIDEMESMRCWLRGLKWNLPASQCNRCRIANKPLKTIPVIDFDLLNTQIEQIRLQPDRQKVLQRFRSRLNNHRRSTLPERR